MTEKKDKGRYFVSSDGGWKDSKNDLSHNYYFDVKFLSVNSHLEKTKQIILNFVSDHFEATAFTTQFKIGFIPVMKLNLFILPRLKIVLFYSDSFDVSGLP